MATAKKFHREKEAYAGYRHAVEEEFGDALWYFTALCRRLEIRVDEILAEAASGENYATSVAANDLLDSPISHVATPAYGSRTRHCASSAGRSGCRPLCSADIGG